MLNFKNLVILFCFLVGFGIGFYFKSLFYKNNFVVGQWDEPPMIVVCPSSSIDRHRVSLAIEWWRKKGHTIKGFHYDEQDIICSVGRFVNGIIFIRDKKEIESQIYAETYKFNIGTNILSAEINMPDKNRFLARLLEHELGHALGYSHVEIQGHIMHPFLELTGNSFWIPD